MPRINLAGRSVGSLTVERPAEDQRNGAPTWWCRCDCGGVVIKPHQHLLGASTTFARHCGGVAHQAGPRQTQSTKPRQQLVGQRFHALLCLSNLDHGRLRRWLCDCGRIVDLRTDAVRGGRRKRCGRC